MAFGGLYQAIKRSFVQEAESKLLLETGVLAETDFLRSEKNILLKITQCPSIKFKVAQLRAIYRAFSSLLNEENGSNDAKNRGCITFARMKKVYHDMYLSCGYDVDSKGRALSSLDRMMTNFDVDDDHNIDFVEVVRELNRMAFSDMPVVAACLTNPHTNNTSVRPVSRYPNSDPTNLIPKPKSQFLSYNFPRHVWTRFSNLWMQMQV